jgi:hypothetical protein
MNLLTPRAQHQFVSVALSYSLLGRGRFDFLSTIGTSIPDDGHNKNVRSDWEKEIMQCRRERFSVVRQLSRACVILLFFLLLGPDYFD